MTNDDPQGSPEGRALRGSLGAHPTRPLLWPQEARCVSRAGTGEPVDSWAPGRSGCRSVGRWPLLPCRVCSVRRGRVGRQPGTQPQAAWARRPSGQQRRPDTGCHRHVTVGRAGGRVGLWGPFSARWGAQLGSPQGPLSMCQREAGGARHLLPHLNSRPCCQMCSFPRKSKQWLDPSGNRPSLPLPPSMEPLPEGEPLAALSPCLPAHCPVPGVL